MCAVKVVKGLSTSKLHPEGEGCLPRCHLQLLVALPSGSLSGQLPDRGGRSPPGWVLSRVKGAGEYILMAAAYAWRRFLVVVASGGTDWSEAVGWT